MNVTWNTKDEQVDPFYMAQYQILAFEVR
jgi:hypothetical protein